MEPIPEVQPPASLRGPSPRRAPRPGSAGRAHSVGRPPLSARASRADAGRVLADTSYVYGPEYVPSEYVEDGAFRTVDFAAINAKLHKWSRLDTFQTPPPQRHQSKDDAREMARQDSPELGDLGGVLGQLQALMHKEMDGLRKDVTRVLRDVKSELATARKNNEKLSDTLLETVLKTRTEVQETIKNETRSAARSHVTSIEKIIRESKSEDVAAVGESIKDSMIASSSLLVQATKERSANDLQAAVSSLKVLISESREEDMGHVVGAIADNKRDDLMLLVRAVRDDVSSVAEAFRAGQAQDLTKVTRAIRESKVESMEAVVEAIQRAKLEDLSATSNAIAQAMRTASGETYLEAVRDEIQQSQKVDLTPVLKAIQETRLDLRVIQEGNLSRPASRPSSPKGEARAREPPEQASSDQRRASLDERHASLASNATFGGDARVQASHPGSDAARRQGKGGYRLLTSEGNGVGMTAIPSFGRPVSEIATPHAARAARADDGPRHDDFAPSTEEEQEGARARSRSPPLGGAGRPPSPGADFSPLRDAGRRDSSPAREEGGAPASPASPFGQRDASPFGRRGVSPFGRRDASPARDPSPPRLRTEVAGDARRLRLGPGPTPTGPAPREAGPAAGGPQWRPEDIRPRPEGPSGGTQWRPEDSLGGGQQGWGPEGSFGGPQGSFGGSQGSFGRQWQPVLESQRDAEGGRGPRVGRSGLPVAVQEEPPSPVLRDFESFQASMRATESQDGEGPQVQAEPQQRWNTWHAGRGSNIDLQHHWHGREAGRALG